MKHTDARIDAYIKNAREFARPILEYIRKNVHKACPDVQETIKWGFPHYEYHGILCSSAAFKEHCALLFWHGALLKDPNGILQKEQRTAMGHFGRINKLTDLPKESILMKLIKEAAALNASGATPKKSRAKPAVSGKLQLPTALAHALKVDKKLRENWQKLTYAQQKEYVGYIGEAKTEPTREKRLAKTLEQVREAKSLNWKYNRKK